MRRTLMVAALAAALSVPIASAAADSGVTVRGLDFPEHTYLTYFGCDDLYQSDNQAPQVRIGGKGDAQLGDRSFGLLVPGSGTASGPVHLTSSIAGTTVAGFSARAETGKTSSTGAAYVWYVTDDLDDGQVWAGRATLSVGASWQSVNAAKSTYSWRLLDSSTGGVVEDAGSATTAAFTKKHGDGPGYMLAGLGCNGAGFSIDGLRFGSAGAVTTYDLEGMTSSVEIEGKAKVKGQDKGISSGDEVAPGTAVTLIGTANDGTGPMGAPMQLRASTGGPFKPVGGPVSAGVDGKVRTVVKPDETTTYRWYLPDLGYTGDTESVDFTVMILPPAGEESPGQPEQPTDESSSAASSEADEGTPAEVDETEVPPLPSQAPAEDSSAEPSEGPSEEPTSEPSPEPTETPAPETTEPAPGEATDATP